MVRFYPALMLIVTLAPAVASDDAAKLMQVNALVQTATKHYEANTLANLITNDYTIINGGGQVWNRRRFLADIADRSATWEANEPENVTFRRYNGDTALVIAVLHIKYLQAHKVHDLRARYMDVWIKQGPGDMQRTKRP